MPVIFSPRSALMFSDLAVVPPWVSRKFLRVVNGHSFAQQVFMEHPQSARYWGDSDE